MFNAHTSVNVSLNQIAPNFCMVDNGFCRLWFSYKTCVAFMPLHGDNAYTVFVHQNDWSTTTGKHLNQIDGGDKKSRLNDSAFAEKYFAMFGQA